MHLLLHLRYDSHRPPFLIKLWLDKAPILFLVVSAVLFVIGFNLFVYIPNQSQVRACTMTEVRHLKLSPQVLFVSLSTNILTGIHSLCLLFVTTWFIYQLKRESEWVKWTLSLLDEFEFLAVVLTLPVSLFILLRGKGMKSLHLRRNLCWCVYRMPGMTRITGIDTMLQGLQIRYACASPELGYPPS